MATTICYVPHRFGDSSCEIIEHAQAIVTEYQGQGFNLTLRQLYYQFVARDLLPNRQSSYDKLKSIISDARLAGLIDWWAIEDRTRFLRGNQQYKHLGDLLLQQADDFCLNKWRNCDTQVEVWIEKDALVGVIEGVCCERDVRYFSCRGFVSQSEMWRAARRFERHISNGHRVVLLHLGDHDPSGIDMTRDIHDRLKLFIEHDTGKCFNDWVTVQRIALTMDQVEQYDPPPNPAKLTDSRAPAYIDEYGHDSWELDALDPLVMVQLINDHIDEYIDQDAWDEVHDLEQRGREWLRSTADDFDGQDL